MATEIAEIQAHLPLKEVAGLRANGVFGVFKVTNDLQVANQQSEHN